MQTQAEKKEKRRIYHKQYQKLYYIANRAKVRAYSKRNREKRKAYMKRWYAAHRAGQLAYCKHYQITHRKALQQYSVEHYAERQALSRQRWAAERIKVLAHYKSHCRWCGETNQLFLQLDHVHSDGHTHRKTIHKASLWHWIIKHNYPKGFQILCANCHFAKTRYEKQTTKRPVTAAMVFGAARARQMARRIGSK
jgi:hypothetical protein